MTARLNRSLVGMLDLLGNAGSASLDIHGRVIVGAPPRPLPGNPIDWLKLVEAGMIHGSDGKLCLTEEGEATRAEYQKGLVTS
jgi:hypothetical protein